MPRPCYKDYATHMLWYYIKTPEAEIHTEIERLNWLAAKTAIDELGKWHQEIVIYVMGSKGPLQESVYNCRNEIGACEPEIWSVIKKVEKRAAELRGLI